MQVWPWFRSRRALVAASLTLDGARPGWDPEVEVEGVAWPAMEAQRWEETDQCCWTHGDDQAGALGCLMHGDDPQQPWRARLGSYLREEVEHRLLPLAAATLEGERFAPVEVQMNGAREDLRWTWEAEEAVEAMECLETKWSVAAGEEVLEVPVQQGRPSSQGEVVESCATRAMGGPSGEEVEAGPANRPMAEEEGVLCVPVRRSLDGQARQGPDWAEEEVRASCELEKAELGVGEEGDQEKVEGAQVVVQV